MIIILVFFRREEHKALVGHAQISLEQEEQFLTNPRVTAGFKKPHGSSQKEIKDQRYDAEALKVGLFP